MQSSSFSASKSATPLLQQCTADPPSSSFVVSAWVTALMVAGPVINMKLVSLTMIIKSMRAGEYTDPPAEGPMIAAI